MPPEGGPLASLCCPRDHHALDVEVDALTCPTCGARYPVREGIPDFASASTARTRRWDAAQAYELAYWRTRDPGVGVDERRRFEAAARALARRFEAVTGGGRLHRVLHVGPAGFGEIHAFEAPERWAVEPLAIALDGSGHLARDGVHYVAALGEALPFADGYFDAALVPNVVDHVAEPARLLGEVHRCLATGAPAWITAHVARRGRGPWLRLAARTRAGYFAGHPFVFSAAELDGLVSSAGFTLVKREDGPSTEVGDEAGPRARLKDLLLASRYLLVRA